MPNMPHNCREILSSSLSSESEMLKGTHTGTNVPFKGFCFYLSQGLSTFHKHTFEIFVPFADLSLGLLHLLYTQSLRFLYLLQTYLVCFCSQRRPTCIFRVFAPFVDLSLLFFIDPYTHHKDFCTLSRPIIQGFVTLGFLYILQTNHQVVFYLSYAYLQGFVPLVDQSLRFLYFKQTYL